MHNVKTPTGGWPVGAHAHHKECPKGQADDAMLGTDCKALATLQAEFALRGHELMWWRRLDGAIELTISRWGLSRDLTGLDEARAFLQQIGGGDGV